MKDSVLGFDRLNRLADPNKGQSSAAGAATPINWDNLANEMAKYDMALDTTTTKHRELVEWAENAYKVIENSPVIGALRWIVDLGKALYENVLKPIGDWAYENGTFTTGILAGLFTGITTKSITRTIDDGRVGGLHYQSVDRRDRWNRRSN